MDRFRKFIFSKISRVNTMFVKLMVSFLIIILLLSIFYTVAYNFSIIEMESEKINSTNKINDYTADKLNGMFSQLRSTLVKIEQDNVFFPLSQGVNITAFDKKLLKEKITEYKISNEIILRFVKVIFILPLNDTENIVTSESTFNVDRFFDFFYSNSDYNKKFWMGEIKKDFTFRYYPSKIYRSYYNYENEYPLKDMLMPVAIKRKINSNFIMVALVDINSLFKYIDKYSIDNFYILNEYEDLIYSTENAKPMDYKYFSTNVQYNKYKDGYLFVRKSDENNLLYGNFLPNTKLQQLLKRTNVIFKLVSIISFLISIVISVFFVKRFNNPVKQIVEIIKKSKKEEHNLETGKPVTDLRIYLTASNRSFRKM